MACLAAWSFPWLQSWLLGEAASRFSADGAITRHGETLLAFCWFLATGLLGMAGFVAWLLARPGGEEEIRRLIRDEVRPLAEGASPGYRLLAASAGLALGTVVLGLALGRRRWLFVEDGPVELAQVLLLGAATALFGGVTVLSAGPRRWPAGCLAGGSLLWLGEEISWGQRIFGWRTPAGWASLNLQQETNLHNLVPPWPIELHNLLPWSALVLLVASFALRWRSGAGRSTVPGALVRCLPPVSLLPLAVAALACQGLRLTGRVRSAEMEELVLCCFALLWAVAMYRAPRPVAVQKSSCPRTRPAR